MMHTFFNIQKNEQAGLPAGQAGFTMLFAVLVASLALSVGLAIYSLTVRELDISSVAAQSQYAVSAADTGLECALYWDSHYWDGVATSTPFATSSDSVAPTVPIFCDAENIILAVPPVNFAINAPQGAGAATTTFTLQFAGQPSCAEVFVSKYVDATNIPRTTVLSYGYNTCANSQTRVERLLQATY